MKTQEIAVKLEETFICAYQNLTNSWQVVKIRNVPDIHLERTVLPHQKILFQAPRKAKLEIFSAKNVTTTLVDILSCEKLKTN